jgi:hypothetical protein
LGRSPLSKFSSIPLRDLQNKLDPTPPNQIVGLRFGVDLRNDLEIVAVFHCLQQTARKNALLLQEYRSWKMLRVRIDGETEKNQLDQRDAQDHGKGKPIPAHLNEFLGDDGKEPGNENHSVI